MPFDILSIVNMKGALTMFGTKKGENVCDAACRAEALREAVLFKAALQGPRF
jgi:hypothetical protein